MSGPVTSASQRLRATDSAASFRATEVMKGVSGAANLWNNICASSWFMSNLSPVLQRRSKRRSLNGVCASATSHIARTPSTRDKIVTSGLSGRHDSGRSVQVSEREVHDGVTLNGKVALVIVKTLFLLSSNWVHGCER